MKPGEREKGRRVGFVEDLFMEAVGIFDLTADLVDYIEAQMIIIN